MLSSLKSGAEHWEIKLVELSPNQYLGSAVDIQNNLYVAWTQLEGTTEKEAFDKMIELTKKNHI